MKIRRALIFVVRHCTKGKRLRQRARVLGGGAMFVVQNSVQRIQLRGVELCWEGDADEAARGNRGAGDCRLVRERQYGRGGGRCFTEVGAHRTRAL